MSATSTTAQVPKLRFPGFEGKWRDCAFGEVASVKHGFAFDGEHFASEGEFIVLTPGNFTADGAFRYQGAKEKFYNSNEFPQEYVLSRGDLLMVMTEQAVGLIGCTLLVPEDGRLLHNQRLGLIQIDGAADAEYLHRYFKTERMRVALSKTGAGTKVRHTSPKRIEGLQINLPTLPEQQKIAAFLTAVDGRIEQLSRKKALLEATKKGVMQQLFTQTLRFQDDHGHDFPDWEEKTLGKVLTIGSGRDYKHLGEGSIPVYGSGGVMTYVDKALYDGESVCIGRKGTIDKPRFVEGAFWTVDTLFYTHSFTGVLPRFVYALFQRINWQTYNEASGVPSLSKSTIENIPVSIPSLPEQTKIAGFLSALDGKIGAVGEQMRQTQAWKKGLLQQMFV